MQFSYILPSILLLPLISVVLCRDPRIICPPQELITPCKCDKGCEGCHVNLVCLNIKNQETLSQVLERSNDYQYETFEIKRSSINHIPSSIFQTKKIVKLYIFLSSMVSIFDRLPSTDNDLEMMHINEAKISRGVQFALFANFKKLNRLTVKDTILRRLDNLFITNMPKSVESLSFYNCSITKLHDRTFAELPNLKMIIVQNSKVKAIKRSMFPSTTKLQTFDFSGNQIQSLPEDMFSNMPQLQTVLLSNNLLSEVKESVYGEIFSRLRNLDLGNNPIKCRCNIRWILSVDRNSIKGICAAPKELEGTKLNDLKTEDFEHCG